MQRESDIPIILKSWLLDYGFKKMRIVRFDLEGNLIPSLKKYVLNSYDVNKHSVTQLSLTDMQRAYVKVIGDKAHLSVET